jgi:CheY-like chemotaxis protein
MILSSLLVSNGVAADLAESGKECLELCRKNNYDLILLDHRMPGIDGVDTFVQLKEIFKEQGREIEAVRYLKNNTPPDLILLDYEMPDLDGYDVMRLLHGTPQTSEIPIIFLTGVDDRDSVMRVVNLKPDGYLLKSMRKSELLDALNRFFVRNILDGGMSQK